MQIQKNNLGAQIESKTEDRLAEKLRNTKIKVKSASNESDVEKLVLGQWYYEGVRFLGGGAWWDFEGAFPL